MPLSLARSQEISAGFIQRQNRRRQTRPTNATPSQLRSLQSWLVVFWMNQHLQSRISRYLRYRGGQRGSRREAMQRYLIGRNQEMDKYENVKLQNLARQHIPDPVLLLTRRPEHENFGFKLDDDDILALNLVRWFKEEFMHWIDPIICPECGGSTDFGSTLTGDEVSREDQKFGAGRVEMHKCKADDSHPVRRFPRYNSPEKLLETREGRCGEFANLFMLFLRSVGLDARIVHNQEDHVWNEYYSKSAERWIHLDSCEAAFDTPFMYELGWGRKMSYVLAFGVLGAEDVSRAYVADYHQDGWERRRKWDEEDLREQIAEITSARRRHLDSVTQSMLRERDARQESWLSDHERRLRAAATATGTHQARQSGTAEWRALRAESGGQNDANFSVISRHKLLMPDYALTKNKSDLTLSGDAEYQDERVVLTPNETSQVGSAFMATSISASSSFVVEMTFRITTAAGQDQGADGMAFVCLSQSGQTPKPKLLGEGGAGLGYDGLGSESDWAVEIDTYQTVDRCNDPPAPHISLHSPPKSHHRHCVAVTPPQTLPNVSDGSERTLRVFANAQTGVIQAALIFTEAEKEEVVPLWEAKLPLAATLIESDTRWLGLTAATGGIAQAHEVLRFDVWDLSRLKETDA